MVDMGKHFDAWSLLVMAITLFLFVAALFTTGFTHDLLLEAGVFLVSVKLILMAYKNSVANYTMQQKLDEIYSAVQRLGDANALNQARQPTGRDCPASDVSDPGPAAERRRYRAKKAWRILQGESPCRVRASHPPVSSLASMAESWWFTRRTRWTRRR
jgi:hypothetical protein